MEKVGEKMEASFTFVISEGSAREKQRREEGWWGDLVSKEGVVCVLCV